MCRQALEQDDSAALYNVQHPAAGTFRLQPRSQAGGCFNTSDVDTTAAAPPGVSSEVYTEGGSSPEAASTPGVPVVEGVQRVSLDAMAGAMVRLLVALPLRDPPQFVQLPRWREVTSGPAVAAVRGALDAPGLLYYAVRAPDHWTVVCLKARWSMWPEVCLGQYNGRQMGTFFGGIAVII